MPFHLVLTHKLGDERIVSGPFGEYSVKLEDISISDKNPENPEKYVHLRVSQGNHSFRVTLKYPEKQQILPGFELESANDDIRLGRARIGYFVEEEWKVRPGARGERRVDLSALVGQS